MITLKIYKDGINQPYFEIRHVISARLIEMGKWLRVETDGAREYFKTDYIARYEGIDEDD